MPAVLQFPTSAAIARRVQGKIAAALDDTRVVLLVGPRQAGKTTLARLYCNDDRPLLHAG